jgi:uncharacterized protein YbaR (Trm112 family)
MSINPDLLKILVCPESKQTLTLASAETLQSVNQAIEVKGLKNRSGNKLTAKLEAALIREDGKLLYPITDGIPVLLSDEGIELK